MARPITYHPEEMIEIIEKYTEETELPILKEVCYLNNWNYDTVMRLQRENELLYQSIKRLLAKKEVVLEKKGLDGSMNKSMAMFSLKQLGWRDRQEVTVNTDDENKNLMAEFLEGVRNGESKKD